MSANKHLNGLPHDLVKSYFGDLRYYNRGYMTDWLFNVAKRVQKWEATLDILKGTVEPADFNLYPVGLHLKDLISIIQKELKNYNLPTDYIIEATIKVEFRKSALKEQLLKCTATLVDREGNKYESGNIIEQALEEDFDPFDSNNIYSNYTEKRRLPFLERIIGKLFSGV